MQQILNRSARREAFELRQAWLIWHEEQSNPAERQLFPSIVPENEVPPKAEFRGIRKPPDCGSGRIRTMFEVIESAQITGFKEAYKLYVETVLNQPFKDIIHLRAPASIFHSIQVYTPLLSGRGWERQRIRCAPNRKWYGTGERGDWAWIQVNPDDNRRSRAARSAPVTTSSLNALGGWIPVRLRCLFRVRLVDNSGIHHSYDLVLCEEPMAVRAGEPDSRTGLVSVCRPDKMPRAAPGANTFKGILDANGANLMVFGAVVVDGAAHCVPLQESGVEWSWIVNSHIDLTTWNTVYR